MRASQQPKTRRTNAVDGLLRTALIGLSVVLALCATPGLVRAQAKQDFRLTNRTGYEINQVYVSESKADDWEEDVLGEDTLEDGSSVDIAFERKTKACNYDLRVTYTDKTTAEWHGLDLCSLNQIVLHYSRKSDETWITTK